MFTNLIINVIKQIGEVTAERTVNSVIGYVSM